MKEIVKNLLILIILAACTTAFGQVDTISGNSGNQFSSVREMILDPATPDSLIVDEPGKFDTGNYVMLYVVKGFDLERETGRDSAFRSCIGSYALFIVDAISGDTIILNASTGFIDPTDPLASPEQKTGWAAQLIKVPVHPNLYVNGELTTDPWDSTSGTGGVLALYVQNRLTLNADINMSGKGFAGADPTGDLYGDGDCFVDTEPLLKKRYYKSTEMDSAGLKGEGTIRSNFTLTRGLGKVMNGGGGGNGKYSGGGGGGNYTGGGKGGGQSTVCGPSYIETQGEGGMAFAGIFYFNNFIYKNRIWLGGGGGTGTQDPSFPATAGGNGGGIVFIVADTIETIGSHAIRADGDSVKTNSMGAGGGGGAGGAIVLEVNGYYNTLKLSAVGGKGGSTGNPSVYTGPGGGGGGGVYWVPKDDVLLDYDDSKPEGGFNPDGANGNPGNRAGLFTGLQAPLNGLVYNSLPPSLTVCSDTIPPTIDASTPKGGDGSTPIIRWIQSTDNINWVTADGVYDQEDYVFTSPLTNTMYYSRVVKIGTLKDSLSTVVTYTVLPKIENNLISTDDILQCEGVMPGTSLYPVATLTGANVNSDTTFQWQKWTTAGNTPVSADGPHNSRIYDLPVMADTTYFRRIVKSGVCRSVSDTIKINVLDAITNNTISSKDTLCYGQSPELLAGGLAGGGDYINYWYNWEKSYTGNNNFISTGITDKDLNTTDSSYNSNRYFRRLVYSGIDSSCVYTSDTFKIEVLDLISNNVIDSDPDVSICQFDQLPDGGLIGLKPLGGDTIYHYTWQVSDNKISWGDSLISDVPGPFNLSSFTGADTLYIRRYVTSGKADVCQDYSNMITVDIVEAITNNVLITDSEIYCYGDTLAGDISAGIAVSAPNELGIQWQYKVDNGLWQAAPEPAEGYSWNYHYNEALSDTLYFRRLVWSRKTDSICSSVTSDSAEIIVQATLMNNTINTDNVTYICSGETLSLKGSPKEFIKGGNHTYNLQWQRKTGTGNYTDASGGQGEDYTETNFTQTSQYRRIINSGACEDTSTTTLITVRELPQANLRLKNLVDSVICEKEVSMIVDITTDEDFLWHRIKVRHTPFTPGDSIGVESSSKTIEFTHSPKTEDSLTYHYILANVVDNKGCIAQVKTGTPSIKVYHSTEPEILSTDTMACGEFISIAGSDLNGADDAYWLELGGTSYVNFMDDHNRFTTMELLTDETGYPYDSMQVTIGWKIVTPRCDSTASKTFTFYQLPDSTKLKKDTVQFYVLETYDLSQLEPQLDAGSGTWSADASGASVIEENIATDFEYEAGHLFTWTVGNGVCEPQTDNVLIIQHDLKKYNGFSPNNDLLNQEFVIPGLIHSEDFTFVLYNSWGTKLMEISKSDALVKEVEIDGVFQEEYLIWDGTLGSAKEAAPPGTYYYSLRYKIGGKTYKPKNGYIILRR